MDLTHDDVAKILKIIDDAPHLDEIEVVLDGFHLHVRRSGVSGETEPARVASFARSVAQESVAIEPDPASVPVAAPALGANEVAIKAPMLGTFYRSPSPEAPAFVEVGQRVRASDTVCIIEVMKLFHSVSAGVDGTVVRIPVSNGSLVEYNQTLVVIER